ncbi:MAG: tRNA dihydrouridine synthase DusB [Deltaproteobacteria bacterium]|nr:MAG: tRNA dihydrouridine synthase DusB [Deltaproteobacteria bacterium]
MTVTATRSFFIGSVEIPGRTVLAPLAGVTNQPFRQMVRRFGCGLVCSEMVSANGLAYGSEKTKKLMACAPNEAPVSIQIFGAHPDRMARAAAAAEAAGADIVDINFGCSVRKVLKTGAGAALMKDLDLSRTIIGAVRKAIRVPLTIKLRKGWDASGDAALALGQAAESEGVDALVLHPRTATQGFGGEADWGLIGLLKAAVRIPVIGNGDVKTPDDALRMVAETGCDAVMIGRAAMGDPAIFSRVESALAGKTPPVVTRAERFDAMRRFVEDTVLACGENNAPFMLRSRLGWLVKGLFGSAKFRERLNGLTQSAAILVEIDAYEAFLATRASDAYGMDTGAVPRAGETVSLDYGNGR